jgi:hypothetical protein
MRICAERRAVRNGSAKKLAPAWNVRVKSSMRSSPATRRPEMEPVSPAVPRSTYLLLGDLLAWSSDLQKEKDGRLYLDHLAFGTRHLPAGARGETVYQLAHRRLNG